MVVLEQCGAYGKRQIGQAGASEGETRAIRAAVHASVISEFIPIPVSSPLLTASLPFPPAFLFATLFQSNP